MVNMRLSALSIPAGTWAGGPLAEIFHPPEPSSGSFARIANMRRAICHGPWIEAVNESLTRSG